MTYVHEIEVFLEAITAEEKLGYAILKRTKKGETRGVYLKELAPIFERMKIAGIEASEHLRRGEFLKALKEYDLADFEGDKKPCECFL